MKISVSLHNAPKKGEDQNLRQVIFRVREGNNDLKVRTDLMADPTLWDESVPGYRRTTKLGKGGTKAFNDKLQDIFRLIEADFTPMRDGKWLKETINGYLHPVAEQPKPFSPLPCEDNEKDTSLENLDKGTVPDWFMKYVEHCDVSHGRKACYLSTIKKLRRYELFKREFEGQKDFNLYPDTFTIDDLYDFYEYVENEYIYYDEHYDWYRQFHIDKKPPIKYTNNYMQTVRSHFRAFMNWMTKNGYSSNMEYKKLTIKPDVYADPIYLTLEERDKVYYTDLTKHPGLSLYRDMFMFQCLVAVCQTFMLSLLATSLRMASSSIFLRRLVRMQSKEHLLPSAVFLSMIRQKRLSSAIWTSAVVAFSHIETRTCMLMASRCCFFSVKLTAW